MINTINLPPFKKMCMTVGNLPSSFMESMTYYEALEWLYQYIDKEIKTAINTNSEAVSELQNAFVILKNYVDTYFDNVDIQTEINNKLDEMAESGELADIIAQYLEVASVLAFDTKASLKAAENLVNGSITKTLGDISYNDGKGNFYKIRTITSGDVIDDDNILALTNYPTLIAEKMPDYRINTINSQITTINNTLTRMNTRKAIIIGDSYANRTNSWADRLKAALNLSNDNCIIKAVSGVGFYATQNSVNFSTMVVDNITIPANEVTDIIVCGGYNDRNATDANLQSAFDTFMGVVNTTYPNATVYVGFIGWANLDVGTTEEWATICNTLAYGRLRYIKICSTYPNVKYLNNVEYALHDISLLDETGFHPTADGQGRLCELIKQAYESGSCNVVSTQMNITSNLTLESYITEITSGAIFGAINNNESRLFGNNALYLTFDQTTSINLSNDIKIGSLNAGYIIGRNYAVECTVAVLVNTKNNSYFTVPGILYVSGGDVYLRARTLNRNGTGWINDAIKYIQIDGINIHCDSMLQY